MFYERVIWLCYLLTLVAFGGTCIVAYEFVKTVFLCQLAS